MDRLSRQVFILLLRGYRILISPLLPRSCRFFPSCAAYAEEAIERLGVGRGARLTLARLLRCRPGHPGGYDPVP